MKRPDEGANVSFDVGRYAKRVNTSGDDMVMQLLFAAKEAGFLAADSGSALMLIESLSGSKVELGGENKTYPGTSFRQFTIRGSKFAVNHAVGLALQTASGPDSSDNTPFSTHVVVPIDAAKDIKSLGGAGQEIEDMVAKYNGLSLTIDPPKTSAFSAVEEQVVRLEGPLHAVQTCIRIVLASVHALQERPWYNNWANRPQYGSAALEIDGCDDVASAGGCCGMTSGGASFEPVVLGAAGVGNNTKPANYFAMKILVSPEEAQSLQNRDGSVIIEEIQMALNSAIKLSSNGMPYPGTFLSEYNVQGNSIENVVGAAVQLLTAILEKLGSLNCGEPATSAGFVRIRTVLPSKAAAALIGPGGQTVKQVRQASQMHVHIETTIVPPGNLCEYSEQVVTLDGPGGGVQTALALVSEVTGSFAGEPWFRSIWASNTHCGQSFPGLMLFAEARGKAKGKVSKGCLNGKGNGKIAYGGMALKILLGAREGSCVVGKAGQTIREIGMVTGTKLTLSNQYAYYPGTQLQELRVLGSTQEAVVNAAMQCLSKIMEETGGTLAGGELGVEVGGARLRVAVPIRVAQAILGPGGQQILNIRQQSGMQVAVEDRIVPDGPVTDVSEQVVVLAGPCEGATIALGFIADALSQFACEAWFEPWASTSHTIQGVAPVGQPFGFKGKGAGKGKSVCADGLGKAGDVSILQMNLVDGAYDFNNFSNAGVDNFGGGIGTFGGLSGIGSLAGVEATTMAPSLGMTAPAFEVPSSIPRRIKLPEKVAPKGGPMAYKLLLAAEEVHVLSDDPATLRKIFQMTQTIGIVSAHHFPGSKLHELGITGPTPEAVFMAVCSVLSKVGETLGVVSSGDVGVEVGGGRVKAVLPKRSAASLLGSGGQQVRTLKQQTGISVSIDMTVIPCSDGIAEQAVVLRGPLATMQPAIEATVVEVANCMFEPWFGQWANYTNSGIHIPHYVLFAPNNTKGKGKGDKDPF